jgi:glyoxylase-like metal-dependent hydrolase (beta-lactamase superfamily II)
MDAPVAAGTPFAEIADAPPAAGEAREIAPGVLWLRMPLPFALNHVNLWLIEERDGYVLVDCGYGDATTRAIWQRHFTTTLAGAPIRRVVATHCHPDHLGNAAWLAAHFGCTVAMSQAEFLAAHAMIGQQASFGQADVRALFARHGMNAEHLAALEARGNAYHRGVPEAPHAFTRLIDGDELALGRWRWRVIAGYGHSPEHAALATAEGGLLISGDMLLPRISTNVAVWPGEPDADPVARFLIASRVRCVTGQHAGAAIARAAVSRHRRAGGAPCRASRAAPRRIASGAGGRARAAFGGGRDPRAVPPRARPAAALLRDGRGDRASQPPVACGTRDTPRRERRRNPLRGVSAAGPRDGQLLTGRLRAAVWRPVDSARPLPGRGRLTAKRSFGGGLPNERSRHRVIWRLHRRQPEPG